MQIDNKAVEAILKYEGWHLDPSKLKESMILCNDKDGEPVEFADRSCVYRHMQSIDQFRQILASVDYIFIGLMIQNNPWRGMSDEQIFIKCELEQT